MIPVFMATGYASGCLFYRWKYSILKTTAEQEKSRIELETAKNETQRLEEKKKQTELYASMVEIEAKNASVKPQVSNTPIAEPQFRKEIENRYGTQKEETTQEVQKEI